MPNPPLKLTIRSTYDLDSRAVQTSGVDRLWLVFGNDVVAAVRSMRRLSGLSLVATLDLLSQLIAGGELTSSLPRELDVQTSEWSEAVHFFAAHGFVVGVEATQVG